MDIRELRIEDRVSHNGDIGKVVEIKTTHVRLMFKDGASYLYNVNELEPIPITDKLIKKIGFLKTSNMWIAREENGELLLFAEKPIHNFHTKSYLNQSGWCDGCYIGELESDIFPEVTFENSPIEVELKIKK